MEHFIFHVRESRQERKEEVGCLGIHKKPSSQIPSDKCKRYIRLASLGGSPYIYFQQFLVVIFILL